MKTHVVYLTLQGKSQIEEISKKYDISEIKQFMQFRNELRYSKLVDPFESAIRETFWSYYKEIEEIESKELLGESFAEKNIKIKHDEYSYSYTFNFYEMLNKRNEKLGFSADRGEALYQLIVNIDFE